MHPATFAGQFYPARVNDLTTALEQAFVGERGPGSLPPRKQDRNAQAVIVPHAGYQFSGAAAAWAYHALAASPFPDLFIILAPNHTLHASGTTLEPFETPLGIVRVEQTFTKALVAKGTLPFNDRIFDVEHSLEVQLPFLQFTFSDMVEQLKIVPILVSNDVDLTRLALDLKETLLDQDKKAIVIVSSDFTHHGRNYHYVRFEGEEKRQKLYDFDGKMIEMIRGFKADEFLAFVEKEGATVCGAAPIALLLKTMKPCTVKLEQYYTSGDVMDDYKNSVGYAAIVFEKKAK